MAGGTWAGAERATGGIVNTGMRLLEFGAQQRQNDERLAMERDRLKMAQDLANKQGRIAEIQAKQAEDDAKLIDVDAHFTQMGHGPEEIAYLKSKAMLDIENINGRDYIQTKRGREIWAGLVNDPQTTVDLATIKAQRADKQIADMTNQLYGEGAAKLKPEQRAELEQQYDALVQQRTAYAEATKIANRALMAKNKERMQTVQKPDGSWASVDPVSGQTFDLPGTPEGIVKTDITTDAAMDRALLIAAARHGDRGTPPVQQTTFIDPVTKLPLVFDKTTGTYRVANVDASGAAPRSVNPSATERERTAQYDVIMEQIQRIKNKYSPRYVGLVQGQVGRVTQWANKDEAEFRQVILDVKDSLLRARSGAQINEQEYARLSKLVPDFTNSEPQFKGNMKAFEETFNSIAAKRKEAQRQGGVYQQGKQRKVGRFTVEEE